TAASGAASRSRAPAGGSTDPLTVGSELDSNAGPSTVPSAATGVRCPAVISAATGGRSLTEMLTVCGKLVVTRNPPTIGSEATAERSAPALKSIVVIRAAALSNASLISNAS